MSFAIIETGGKQYKVSASKILEVEKLNAEKGKTIQFKKVLLLNDDKNTEVGSPNIEGAIVEAKLLDTVPPVPARPSESILSAPILWPLAQTSLKNKSVIIA